jgi:Ca2+-binding RTX toxin-like protein
MSGVFIDLGADNDVAGGAGFNDTILGNVGDDTIAGFGGNDSLLGGNDNDFINGGDGDDTIYGGAGNDLLLAGAGNDRLFGEGGNDSFVASSTPGSDYNQFFNGGAGDDVFFLYEGNDTVIGGSGYDRVEFLSGNQTIDLTEVPSENASGIDHIVLAGANQQLLLSAADVLRLTDSGILRVSGADGNAIDPTDEGWVRGASADGFTTFTNGAATVLVADNLLEDEVPGETRSGTEGNDSASLGAGSDSYLGLGGNDSVLGNAGNDTIDGGNGADTIIGGSGDDSILGGNGDDRIWGGLGNDTIDAGAGNSDRIRYEDLASSDPVTVVISNSGSNSGFNRATVSTATQGTDSIMGFEILTTTTGNDFITVNSVATANALLNIFANNGNDTIIFNTSDLGVLADYQHGSTLGGVTVDLLAGTAIDPFGTDSLVGVRGINGSDQSDILLGSDFNDRFRGRQGNDYMDGRGGSDMVDYAYLGSGQAISVNLAEGRANDGQGGTDTLISIEQVRGGAGNDTIIGDSANNNIIRGNAGSDSLDGGAGTSDLVDYSLNSLGVSVNLVAGRGVDGATSTDTLAGFEQVHGSAFDDTLIADAFESNVLRGNAGNDLLDGGAGGLDIADYSTGVTSGGVSVNLALGVASGPGVGTDTLIGIERAWGSSFGDTLIGNNVMNRFLGLGGNDSMDGGLGSDWVEYNSSAVTAGVTVNLTTGTASDGFGGTDSFTSFENVIGSRLADHITGIELGGTGIGRLRGGAGSDTLIGIAGQFILADYADQTVGLSVNLASGSVNDGLGGVDQLVNIRGAFMFGNFADTLLGTNENEWFFPSGGNDTVVGGDGFDIIHYDGNPTGGVSVNLAAGSANDGDGGTDSFTGIEGVAGGYASDTILGDGFANLINPGASADSVDAGAGQDTVSYSLGFSPGSQVYNSNEAQDQLPFTGVTIDLAAGRATDYSGAADTILNFEAAIGSTMHDSILGSSGNDVLDGAEGNDIINGGNGADTIYGGSGDDSILGGNGDDRIWGGLGNDTIDAGAGNSDRIRYDQDGTEPVTVVISNSGSNSGFNRATVSTATQGTDSIMGFEILTTTTGNDFITVNSVATANALLNIFANNGNDTIIFNTSDLGVLADYQHGSTLGGVTVDLLAGTAIDPFGTDSLVGVRGINGSDQSDILLGSDFNDRFRGRQGNDYMDGRGGSDMVDYAYLGSGQAVSVNLAEGRANDGQGGTDTLISIEQVRGGSGNDTIIGDGANNNFRGNAGNDLLDGGGGDFDVVDYSFASAGVSVDLLLGVASDGQGGTDTLANIEFVWGSSSADTLIGGAGNDILRGNAGSDIINGGEGSADIADYRNATAGITVNMATGVVQDGQGGTDALSGIEQIWGSTFNDSMLGGEGNDYFVGSSGADTFVGGNGIDSVNYNFNPANNTAAPQGVSIDLAAGTGRDGYGSAEILQSIEIIYGTSFADTISGGAASETFYGNGGADVLDGGAGNDLLIGNGLGGTLSGGAGDDVILVGGVTLTEIYALFGP